MVTLTRISDDRGDICQLSDETPGVLYDPVSGKPVVEGSRRWWRMVDRLVDLQYPYG